MGLEEDAMCTALDQLVREHGFSYTECCFQILDGKQGKGVCGKEPIRN